MTNNTFSLTAELSKVSQDSSYEPDKADSLYLWVINTGEVFPTMMELRSQYLAGAINLKYFVGKVNSICLSERVKLQKAEDISKIGHASCMGASLMIVDYYVNVYAD